MSSHTPGRRGGVWTDARIEQLRALWVQGVPSHEIARVMGITRGMVSGKRYGLGLPCRTGEVARAAEALNARRAAAIYRNVADAALARREVILRHELASLEAVIRPLLGSSPRPWEQRERHECAFPVEGYGMDVLSCCLPVVFDAQGKAKSYCLGHCEILAGRPWPPEEPSPELVATQYEAVA